MNGSTKYFVFGCMVAVFCAGQQAEFLALLGHHRLSFAVSLGVPFLATFLLLRLMEREGRVH